MPLEAPKLDDRTFDDLVREARLRIPRYTSEWTDFNDSDPGMTLVQLFAWLSEMLLYRMNKMPERSYIKFLQLLNMELRPAQPAVAHLTFSAEKGAPDVPPVPPGARIQAKPPGGDALIFETGEGLDLIRFPLTEVQVFDGTAYTLMTSANLPSDVGFRPFGWTPQINSALFLGFEPPEQPVQGRMFPRQMRFRVYLPIDAQAGRPQDCREVVQPPAPPVNLEWEYLPTPDASRWRRLNVFKDETAAFTREGYVLVQGPAEISATRAGKVDKPYFWLRCRLAGGRYPEGAYGEIDFIRTNTVPVRNLATIREEIVGTSEGHPDQSFNLKHQPVQNDSLDLWVEAPDGDSQSWKRADDFLGSQPDDPHYVLNHNTGNLRFGNGSRGLIPPAGAQIVAREYRYGGGSAGNVGVGMINAPVTGLTGVKKVINERAAVGGRDEQALGELKEQAPAVLRSRNRAVTVEDFAALAAKAGGVCKATAIPLAHPDHPEVKVPGAVTVVIVPDTDERPPRPSSDLIRYVCRYLDEYRLITTEMFVKGPEYKDIKLEVRVVAEPYAALDDVARRVQEQLNASIYLDPKKQAFGRDLYPTRFYDVILDVADVRAVENLSVIVNGRLHEPISKKIESPADGLFYGVDHEIVVQPYID